MPQSPIDVYVSKRRRRIGNALSWGLTLGAVAVLGLRDIPPQYSIVYLVGAAINVYSIFSLSGVFSVFDLVGWLSMFGGAPGQATEPSRPAEPIRIGSRGAGKRIGLVLAGGGGKGAYQIGCWKAMERRGLKISAVAGTSVGALNAAMMARGDVTLAEQIWRRLSASQLMRIDFVALLFAPFTNSRYRRHYQNDRAPFAIVPLVGVSILILVGVVWYLSNQLRLSWTNQTSILAVVIPFLWIALTIIYILRLLLQLSMALPLRNAIPMAPAAFFTGGLQKLVKDIAPAGTFMGSSCHCIVTTAEESLLYDPDDQDHDRGAAHYMRTRRRFEPRVAYLPVYWPMGRLEAEIGTVAAHFILGLSAALPVLFTALRIKRKWHYDGALADRLPILPLLDFDYDRVFVIHLDATGTDPLDGRTFNVLSEEGLRAKLDWQDRMKRLAREFSPELDATVQRMSLAPLLDRSRQLRSRTIGSEIIHVIPSRDLGSFWSGTMNFTGRKARALIQLGEQDMDQILDSLDADR